MTASDVVYLVIIAAMLALAWGLWRSIERDRRR